MLSAIIGKIKILKKKNIIKLWLNLITSIKHTNKTFYLITMNTTCSRRSPCLLLKYFVIVIFFILPHQSSSSLWVFICLSMKNSIFNFQVSCQVYFMKVIYQIFQVSSWYIFHVEASNILVCIFCLAVYHINIA